MQEQPRKKQPESLPLFAVSSDVDEQENIVRFINERVKQYIKELPGPVFETVAAALYEAKLKRKHRKALPLRGFLGTTVVEIRKPHSGDTYRVVYAVGVPDSGTILVLDAFKKKSHDGSELPRVNKERIEDRLAAARLRSPEEFDLW